MTPVEFYAACKPVRKWPSGSNPWIIQGPDGIEVEGPRFVFDHPQLGKTVVSGGLYWKLKRDAQAALDELRRRAREREKSAA